MGFWTAVVIIVAIGTLSEVYRARLKQQSNRSDEELSKVWTSAIEESWGKIDLGQFEVHWREYVLKKLK